MNTFENTEPARPDDRAGAPVRVVVCVGLVWAAMLAADWTLRFAWYGWQVNLVSGAASAETGPSAPLLTIEVAASRGGDLTHLLGIPKAAAPFEQEHPAMVEQSDEFGFRNIPPAEGRSFSIVTAGDSFIAAGSTMTNTLNARLSAVSGLEAYNYAYPGRGPIFSVTRFLHDERFRQSPPKVLVWGLVEREIGGDMFADM